MRPVKRIVCVHGSEKQLCERGKADCETGLKEIRYNPRRMKRDLVWKI